MHSRPVENALARLDSLAVPIELGGGGAGPATVSAMTDSFLSELAATASGTGARAARAGACAELIRFAMTARWVGIYTVADDGVHNEAWSGPAAAAHSDFAATKGLTAHAIRSRSVALSNDVAQDPRYLANQADSGSELIVLVIDGKHVVGTLDVESE